MNIIIAFFWFLLGILPAAEHDFHLSRTDIHFRPDISTIQLTIHIFIDDLELAVVSRDSIEMKLFTQKEFESSDRLIEDYLSGTLVVHLDDHLQKPRYLGREISEDLQAVWIYMEIEDVPPFKQMHVENSILLETYSDQKNILNVKTNRKLISFEILDAGDYRKTVEF